MVTTPYIYTSYLIVRLDIFVSTIDIEDKDHIRLSWW